MPASLAIALLAVACVAAPAFAQPEPEVPFEAVDPGAAGAPPEAIDRLRELVAEAYFLGNPLVLRLAGVAKDDAAALDRLLPEDTTRVAFRLGEVRFVATGKRQDGLPAGFRAWSGSLLQPDGDDVLASVDVVWSDDSASIDVERSGEILRVRALGRGLYAFYRVDPAALPQDLPPLVPPGKVTADERRERPFRVDAADVHRNAVPPPSPDKMPPVPEKPVRIGVAMAFTKEGAREVWKERRPDVAFDPEAVGPILTAYARERLRRTNDALERSGVQARLWLVEAWMHSLHEPTTGTVSDAMNGMMPASRRGNQGLHCRWGRAGSGRQGDYGPGEPAGEANLLVLVGRFGPARATDGGRCGLSVKPIGHFLGRAQLRLVYDESSSSEDAMGRWPGVGYFGYVIVKKVCADDVHTLAHELGHVLGTNHARTEVNDASKAILIDDGPGESDFGYGHLDGRRVTVEVAAPEKRSLRQPRYSNAAQAGWGSPKADSVRLMNMLAPLLARRPPPHCTSPLEPPP